MGGDGESVRIEEQENNGASSGVLWLWGRCFLCSLRVLVITAALAKRGVSLPITAATGNYGLDVLAIYRQVWMKNAQDTAVSWWKYLLIAFVDLEANFLIVLAYSKTSITRHVTRLLFHALLRAPCAFFCGQNTHGGTRLESCLPHWCGVKRLFRLACR